MILKQDCYVYFLVEPIPQEFEDNGQNILIEVDVCVSEMVCKLALLGDKGIVHCIRIFLPDCEGQCLTDEQEKCIHQVKEQAVSTLRLPYDPKIKIWSHSNGFAIREGRHFKIREAKKHTLEELINRYIEHILKPRKLSRQERFTHFEWWKKSLGCYLLSDVTPALIAETRDILAKGTTYRGTQRSSATVVRYLASLSHAFTIAVKEWGWVENNPVFLSFLHQCLSIPYPFLF